MFNNTRSVGDQPHFMRHNPLMFLARSVEYALRVMAYVALHSDDQRLSSKSIGTEINVPQAYLSKILRRMVAGGLLASNKGHGGGFILSRPPAKIKLIDVFAAMEQDISPRRCVFGLAVCSSANPCVLHHRWDQLNTQFQDWARNTSLEDIRQDVLNLATNGAQRKQWKRAKLPTASLK